MKALITDAEYADLTLERAILEAAGIEVVVGSCRTPEDVVRAGGGATALLVQYASITADVLVGLPEVRIVSRYGVGVDNIDADAARERGVWVANVPDYGTEEVALHTVALLLALLRHVPFHDRQVRSGHWDSMATGGDVPRVSDLTLGVVGLGRVGSEVVRRCGSWFARVVGHDPQLPAGAWPAGVDGLGLDEVFAVSDAVTLHLPLSDATHGLVSTELLRHGRGLHLVNTARGGLVDLDALVDALDAGTVRAAALDVLPEEPPREHAILRHPRVLVTPHVAWYSTAAEDDVRRQAAQNIVAWHRTGRPNTPVVGPDEDTTPRPEPPGGP